ncbi:hypothetical protein [Clostridium sp. ZBS15]|uniref:hypothetical protein n=1 Tax=Clostridium sp. ZBS15 TaxID=2949969 RepID=UPI00207AF39F|nr:hypothetical protein [Clostridium sp. ZBS15]
MKLFRAKTRIKSNYELYTLLENKDLIEFTNDKKYFKDLNKDNKIQITEIDFKNNKAVTVALNRFNREECRTLSDFIVDKKQCENILKFALEQQDIKKQNELILTFTTEKEWIEVKKLFKSILEKVNFDEETLYYSEE